MLNIGDLVKAPVEEDLDMFEAVVVDTVKYVGCTDVKYKLKIIDQRSVKKGYYYEAIESECVLIDSIAYNVSSGYNFFTGDDEYTIHKKQTWRLECECGAEKTYKDCPDSFHSDYCPKYRPLVEKKDDWDVPC